MTDAIGTNDEVGVTDVADADRKTFVFEGDFGKITWEPGEHTRRHLAELNAAEAEVFDQHAREVVVQSVEDLESLLCVAVNPFLAMLAGMIDIDPMGAGG